jgi:hypothetical protein
MSARSHPLPGKMIGFLRPMETEFFHETRFWDNWKPADYRAMVAARDLL